MSKHNGIHDMTQCLQVLKEAKIALTHSVSAMERECVSSATQVSGSKCQNSVDISACGVVPDQLLSTIRRR